MDDVDYDETAINMRLRQVSALRDLCLSLGKATIIRDGEPRAPRDTVADPERTQDGSNPIEPPHK